MQGAYFAGTPKRYSTEAEARKAAQTMANRQQREVAVTWASNEGTQRALICRIAPNRRPRTRKPAA
ncbi:MAG: hypothetical protein WBA46_06385 [Thermomicrobiales bacterium]